MSKKNQKSIEQLTEEYFALERAEYEKRVPQAFPRIAAGKAAVTEESGPVEEEAAEEKK